MPKIKLVASDMDGTLLDSNKQISTKNVIAINQLNQKNILFAIASGRNYRELEQYIAQFAFPIPVIALNGGLIYDAQGQVIESNPFSINDLKLIVNILTQLNVYFELLDDAYFYSNSQMHRYQLIANLRQKLSLCTDSTEQDERYQMTQFCQYDDELLYNKKIYKFRVFNLDNVNLDMVKSEVLKKIPCEISSSATFNIEINPAGISKGKGIKTLCRHYHLDTSAVLAIGDNLNDLSMIETAGYFCAMGNSHPLIIQQSDHITESNDEHGVAKAISMLIE